MDKHENASKMSNDKKMEASQMLDAQNRMMQSLVVLPFVIDLPVDPHQVYALYMQNEILLNIK